MPENKKQTITHEDAKISSYEPKREKIGETRKPIEGKEEKKVIKKGY